MKIVLVITKRLIKDHTPGCIGVTGQVTPTLHIVYSPWVYVERVVFMFVTLYEDCSCYYRKTNQGPKARVSTRVAELVPPTLHIVYSPGLLHGDVAEFSITVGFMALLLDGISEIGAHVRSNICYSIYLRHML